ncbi:MULTISPECIES: DUF4252 domain-containing protein [Chryseobacterium]|jgi:hypothetical protein|uniref:Putative auto-transporter adhesin head GIN domain-containing protein n=1 Tax=Chryseobacterium geocarposphaerae TaxID=1416776 RepID=A0ABU1LG63_9FLAO|nr:MULTISPECIES: DUF4252 domain-containing protein [Chryseobacterium]MDR6405717.1 hypothetical protein [Chryseobacterium geocarposphaerae]MDR6699121.1 hypothetical protein [Chryseobacterium ginsenosidimutans]
MKKIIIIFALAFSHFYNVYGQKDKLDQLFEKYQEVEGVTSIKIAKPMFGMLSSLDLGDAELDQMKPLLSKINGLKVFIAEKSTDGKSMKGQKLAQINKDISSYLSDLNYSEIMTMNSGGAKIKFLSSEEKNGIMDDLLLSIDSGGDENILVKLDGKLSMDDINKIISSSETKINPITNTRSSLTSDNTSSYLSGESRSVGEFSGIHVSTGVNVVFKQESPTNIKVIADADKLQYIMTKVENGVLKVYVDNKGQKNLKFKNISVNVSSPRMDNIKTSSGSTFTTINSVRENNLTIDASSGSVVKGKFHIANETNVEATSGSDIKIDLNSKNLIFKGSSGSDSSIEGQAGMAKFDISSGAICKGENFRANQVEAESTSGASISVNVVDKLKAKASSGGLIKYKGNPEITSDISKMSGGSLKQIN